MHRFNIDKDDIDYLDEENGKNIYKVSKTLNWHEIAKKAESLTKNTNYVVSF